MAAFNNQATLTYNGNTINSNTVSGNLLEVLSITKNAVSDTYTANGEITYVISITNTGTAAMTGIDVTDNLGAYTFDERTLYPLTYVAGSVRYYENGVLQTAPTVNAGPPLTFEGITVPAGGNAILIYAARANEYAPLDADGTITNTARTASECAGEVETSETVNALSAPDLSITKFVSPEAVTACGELTYTFIIQNTGSAAVTAADGVAVSDDFDPALSDITVTFNDEAWTEGTEYTYDETSGEFRTVLGEITVPAATFTQNAETGRITVTPGVSVLTVKGTI